MVAMNAEWQGLKKRIRFVALLFFLFAIAGLLASVFVEYGLYIFFWFGLGGALTSLLFTCLLLRMQNRMKNLIRVVASLQFVYVMFSLWQTSLEREHRVDWIWFFPWDFAAFGGVVAAGICYCLVRLASRLFQAGE